MEKYSGFSDKFYGINPFLQPPRQKLSFVFPIIFMKNLFFYILYLIGFNTLSYIIDIKAKIKKDMRIILSNSVTYFDEDILKSLFPGHKIFYNKKDGLFSNNVKSELDWNSIVFIEECSSNNKCMMRFYRELECDYICIMNYSPNCIHVHGNYYKFLFFLLASRNKVEIKIYEAKSSREFKKYIKVVDLGKTEKNNFMNLITNE
ncbi:hypothetical protein SLOPH_1756 [Spraguea lophii 42_110]|uniref:Uncharacterized protein n=1 Tax=Spraguea lophii (strain 42_110) TaxID=1358809 RepID=S7W755_SPRLO|nr:hypothetical protein SLOPH_1756 [Spraguea lophii 42_110]